MPIPLLCIFASTMSDTCLLTVVWSQLVSIRGLGLKTDLETEKCGLCVSLGLELSGLVLGLSRLSLLQA